MTTTTSTSILNPDTVDNINMLFASIGSTKGIVTEIDILEMITTTTSMMETNTEENGQFTINNIKSVLLNMFGDEFVVRVFNTIVLPDLVQAFERSTLRPSSRAALINKEALDVCDTIPNVCATEANTIVANLQAMMTQKNGDLLPSM